MVGGFFFTFKHFLNMEKSLLRRRFYAGTFCYLNGEKCTVITGLKRSLMQDSETVIPEKYNIIIKLPDGANIDVCSSNKELAPTFIFNLDFDFNHKNTPKRN